MRIAFVGNFARLHDEEYIARSFEMLGHSVYRLEQSSPPLRLLMVLERLDAEVILFTKWESMPDLSKFRDKGVKTVCWLFDLYWGYVRENRLHNAPYFKADYVITTDGGNQERFKEIGINHYCVRQGIYRDECVLLPASNPQGVIFVGSNNMANEERTNVLKAIPGLTWFGKRDTNQIRGMALNELYARTKIVVGDSVYSPHYWSNRVVETLGRGGFLIHQEVPGLKEEYPHIVTYKRGDVNDLHAKIAHYTKHEAERLALIKENFLWVKERYTMDKKCAEVIRILETT